jgi:hypothetical protein
LVGAYGLTTGSGIVEALVRAREREVDVRLIADKTTPYERESGIEPLAAAGVPTWIDDQARIAHGKTMVIDSAVTLMGSMNWSNGAAAVNSEDLKSEDSTDRSWLIQRWKYFSRNPSHPCRRWRQKTWLA